MTTLNHRSRIEDQLTPILLAFALFACGESDSPDGAKPGGAGGTAGRGTGGSSARASGGKGGGGAGSGGIAGSAASGATGGSAAGSGGAGNGGSAGSGGSGASKDGGGAGSGGAGGSGGVTGSGGVAGKDGGAASGGTAGAGGTAGKGGTAGMGGTAGKGGTAGTGGTSGMAGTAGTGGSGGTSSCANPVFVTSDKNGGWSDGGYYVHNNMWNSSVTLGPETLYACSYHDWYVVSNQTNEAGAVKTYPNVHKDYANVPLSSFNTITSRFAATSPHVGIYDVAYDIWTNGVATSGSTEFMIWTENYNQVPSGTRVARMNFGGRDYDVWKTSNNQYIAFVPTVAFTSGTINLLEMLKWTMAQGWFRSDSTLGQIGFGVEIVSTAGANATYRFTDFSITTN